MREEMGVINDDDDFYISKKNKSSPKVKNKPFHVRES